MSFAWPSSVETSKLWYLLLTTLFLLLIGWLPLLVVIFAWITYFCGHVLKCMGYNFCHLVCISLGDCLFWGVSTCNVVFRWSHNGCNWWMLLLLNCCIFPNPFVFNSKMFCFCKFSYAHSSILYFCRLVFKSSKTSFWNPVWWTI